MRVIHSQPHQTDCSCCIITLAFIKPGKSLSPWHDVEFNIFRFMIQPVNTARFAQVEEDVPPTHLLVSDYATWLD